MFLRSKLPRSIELVMLEGPVKSIGAADKDVARMPGPFFQWWMDASDAKGPDDMAASVQRALRYATDFIVK